MTTRQPDHWTRADGTDIPGPNPAPYALPAARGNARADEIAQALAAGIDPRPATVVVHDERVSELLNPRTRGESVTYTRPAPSWDTATRSDRTSKRNSKGGTTTTVTRRGRVVVVGDSAALDDQTTRNGRIPRVVISHAIDALRDGNRYGHADGDQLAALTTRLYDVPDLIGSDHWSWSQATVEIPVADIAALATHTCGLTAGIVQTVDSHAMPLGEWRVPRKPRSHVTRRRVAVPRKRAADPQPRETVRRGVWSWEHWTELPAGADDAAYMFVGHRKVRRGETAQARRRAVVVETFVIDRGADIADALAALASVVQDDGPARYAWRVDGTDHAGLLTIDKRKRVSVTAAGIDPIRQVRTVDALRKRIALALPI